MKISSHLDFQKTSQIINIKLHEVSSLPTGWAGGLVYLTTDNKVYYFNGTAWIPINDTSGLITGVAGGTGITVSTVGGVATVTLVTDGSTLESVAGAGGAARIKDAGVTAAKLASNSVETVKIKDANVTAAKLATDSVETVKIKDANVTAAKLASNSVETVKIKDANVTAAKLATDSVETVKIKDANVTADKLASNSVTTIKVLDKNITFAKIQDVPTMTVIGRVAGSTGVSSAITILTDLNAVISAHDSLASAKAVKDYVDAVVGGLGSLQGGFDAAGATTFPTGSKKGDYWYCTSAKSNLQGVSLNIGDVLISNKDNASGTVAADWIFLEVNRDQASTTVLGVVSLATAAEATAMASTTKALTPSNLASVKASAAEVQAGSIDNKFVTPAGLHERTATETRMGIAEIATQAEVNAGTDDARIVTPLKLKVYAENLVSAYGRYLGDVGNGSATSIVVTHGLATRDVMVEVWDATSFETVLCDVQRTSTTTVTLGFAVAPTASQYRVAIRK